MLEQIWNYLDKFSIYVEFILFVGGLIVAFRLGKLADNRQRRKLRKILGFKPNVTCEVMLPTWPGNLEYSVDETATFSDRYGQPVARYDYIRNGEAEALLHIQKVCDMAGVSKELVLKSPTAADLKDTNNKFICGGPLANLYLKRIFSGSNVSPFSFKRKFLFGCKPHWQERQNNGEFREIQMPIPEDAEGRRLFVEDGKEDNGELRYRELVIPEGYVILIKQTSKKRGTFFISFGNNAVASMKGVRSLIEDTDDVYDLVKKHKEHFFLIFKCAPNGDLSFEEDCLFDLTEEMFGAPKKQGESDERQNKGLRFRQLFARGRH